MSKEFGCRLSDLLKQCNLTQKEFANRVGLTEAAVSRYIAGLQEPRAITVANMAKALNVSPQVLLGAETSNDIDSAVYLVARNAKTLSKNQRIQLIMALAQLPEDSLDVKS